MTILVLCGLVLPVMGLAWRAHASTAGIQREAREEAQAERVAEAERHAQTQTSLAVLLEWKSTSDATAAEDRKIAAADRKEQAQIERDTQFLRRDIEIIKAESWTKQNDKLHMVEFAAANDLETTPHERDGQ